MPELESNRLLVIGAGAGLSASIARRFAREGFAVTLAARTQRHIAPLADELTETGGDADVLLVDAGDPAGLSAALQRYADQHAPDVVVYNAAHLERNRILDTPLAEHAAAHAVDVLGAIATAQVFLPAMREAGRGTFLITGGGLAEHPSANFATLSMGKAGVRSASALMHAELAPTNVHVSSVAIAGAIQPGTAFAPDAIAEIYWQLHIQPAEDWSAETFFTGE